MSTKSIHYFKNMITPATATAVLFASGVSQSVINKLSVKAKMALAFIQNRAKSTGGFVTLEYEDNKGDIVKYQFRVGSDYAKKYELERMRKEKDGIPSIPRKKGNWVSMANKSGVKGGVLEYNGTVYIMATKVKRNRAEDDTEQRVRTIKVESITNMISGKGAMAIAD